MLRARRWIQWLPVRDAGTGFTVNCPKRLVAPYVPGGVLRVPLNLDRSELVVRPNATKPAAQGAIAGCGYLGSKWQRETHGAAVA